MASAQGDSGPFIDFMLDKILRALKAKGQAYEMPSLTQADLAAALQLSVKAVEKNIKQLKDAGLLRRVGPDRGGHWEVV